MIHRFNEIGLACSALSGREAVPACSVLTTRTSSSRRLPPDRPSSACPSPAGPSANSPPACGKSTAVPSASAARRYVACSLAPGPVPCGHGRQAAAVLAHHGDPDDSCSTDPSTGGGTRSASPNRRASPMALSTIPRPRPSPVSHRLPATRRPKNSRTDGWRSSGANPINRTGGPAPSPAPTHVHPHNRSSASFNPANLRSQSTSGVTIVSAQVRSSRSSWPEDRVPGVRVSRARASRW